MKIFAYGSNMHLNRLRNRVPSATKISNAFIEGYALVCNKISIDKSSKANIVKSDNLKDIVWGILFEIEDTEKSILDKAEGLGKGYIETTMLFTDINDLTHEAQVYIADDEFINNKLKPYDWYKQFILEGAKQNQLPETYIEKIESLEFEMDEDKARRNKHLAILNEEK